MATTIKGISGGGSKVFIDGVKQKEDLNLKTEYVSRNLGVTPYDTFFGSFEIYGELYCKGQYESTSIPTVYKYNSANNTWTYHSILTAFGLNESFVLNNITYLTNADGIYTWDGINEPIACSGNLYNKPYSSSTLLVLKNILYALWSGYDDGRFYKYNDATDTWISLTTVKLRYNFDNFIADSDYIYMFYTHSSLIETWDGSSWDDRVSKPITPSTNPFDPKYYISWLINNDLNVIWGSTSAFLQWYQYNKLSDTWTLVNSNFEKMSNITHNNEVSYAFSNAKIKTLNEQVYRIK